MIKLSQIKTAPLKVKMAMGTLLSILSIAIVALGILTYQDPTFLLILIGYIVFTYLIMWALYTTANYISRNYD